MFKGVISHCLFFALLLTRLVLNRVGPMKMLKLLKRFDLDRAYASEVLGWEVEDSAGYPGSQRHYHLHPPNGLPVYPDEDY